MAYIYLLLSMALTIYDEAGGQGTQAMSFVADTVINRVHNPRFPNTVDGVIYQRGQFAWTSKYRHKSTEDLNHAKQIMIRRKERHQSPIIWIQAIDIASKSLAHDYTPKTHELYFSTKTIKAHSYSYKHHSKHKR
ncbi:cell wall hydrolase [Herbiconiux daphne]|uniref:Cell wall hydrolase n=1 Tax=Herbiconiux daphne TaxID=2970914 RepID=A0ABT2HB08_9MICO|nr:cell wall hydrolase [Herbiconiux daphne]MCS5737158.1 cell wall hydrolase [Herbiconiux daphne]